MKPRTLTRQEMYDLVWSKPMTQLALEFDISDVGLRKICKAAKVPTPGIGYWAKLANGKAVAKMELPTLYSFQSQLVYIGGGSPNRYGYIDEPDRTDEEWAVLELPPPPVFPETLEEIRSQIEKLVPLIAIPKKMGKPHPITARLLAYDVDIAKERHYWYKPKYQHPNGQKLINALNSFFIYFESLGFLVKINGPRSQALSVNMDGKYHFFRFVCFDDGNHFYRKKSGSGMTYGFSWTGNQERMSENSDYREYSEITPEVLRDLAIELLMDIEERKRSSVEWVHQRLVHKKRDAIQRIEEKRTKAAIRRRKDTERLIEKRMELMRQALKDMKKAEKMQELITALDEKSKATSKEIPGFKKWRSWAVHQVNSMDPRNMSVKRAGRWIEKFEFR
ncbi:hypothetical protein [Polynucleobacter sphagniphilus]|jgi:hypothetical protein|uniref:hypothetical protein n=1 Tax=Polynucleobacter sphagniphilus TaxID=1743169 RepID=UPI0024756E9A|nr:hypothetical protein [Polynucleobacter sphagniphilus]MDH6299752.1 hypothetical protein [Polynucleobacter sphagniphilus]